MTFIINAIIFLFTWLGSKSLKIAKVAAQFLVLVGINTSLLLAYIAYVGSILNFFYWIYEKINKFLYSFKNFYSDEILIQSINLLKAIGIWDGFVDSFKILSVGFVFLFITYLLRIGLKALLQLRFTILSLIVASK